MVATDNAMATRGDHSVLSCRHDNPEVIPPFTVL